MNPEKAWQNAREEQENEQAWQLHDALHDGENDDPAGCWICREALDEFIRSGETLTDAMIRARQAPDSAWRTDAQGYVTAPLVNEGVR